MAIHRRSPLGKGFGASQQARRVPVPVDERRLCAAVGDSHSRPGADIRRSRANLTSRLQGDVRLPTTNVGCHREPKFEKPARRGCRRFHFDANGSSEWGIPFPQL